DTMASPSVQEAYHQAVRDGANFVVGPLMKDEVYQLSRLSSYQLSAPILALNTSPKIRSIPQKFYQFSLSPEGEAEQVAIKAFKEGYRFAGVITPRNKWGERVQEAFTQRWHELGGRVVSSAKLKPEYDQSQTISQLLNVDDSQKRSLKVKNM